MDKPKFANLALPEKFAIDMPENSYLRTSCGPLIASCGCPEDKGANSNAPKEPTVAPKANQGTKTKPKEHRTEPKGTKREPERSHSTPEGQQKAEFQILKCGLF